MWMKQHRNKCNIMGTIHCAPQTLLAEQAPWASATPALTTKDPFTGTETLLLLLKLPKTGIINNEGPLYGDGNSRESLRIYSFYIINNEGPLYGDGNFQILLHTFPRSH